MDKIEKDHKKVAAQIRKEYGTKVSEKEEEKEKGSPNN
jgi:hypothetical protein